MGGELGGDPWEEPWAEPHSSDGGLRPRRPRGGGTGARAQPAPEAPAIDTSTVEGCAGRW